MLIAAKLVAMILARKFAAKLVAMILTSSRFATIIRMVMVLRLGIVFPANWVNSGS